MTDSGPSKRSPSRRKSSRKNEVAPDRFLQALDAIADVVADRVLAKLAVRDARRSEERSVPVWLPGPKRPRGSRPPPIVGKPTTEQLLRRAGMLKMGDPGYDQALREHLVRKEAHDFEIAARASLRKAARLLRKLIDREVQSVEHPQPARANPTARRAPQGSPG